jgi:hypothetical protein
MTARAEDLVLLCSLVGSDVVRVIDPMRGWPGLVEVRVGEEWQCFSMHVGRIHSMSRREHEYRFQNALGHEMTVLPDSRPLLLGLWCEPGERPVIVAAQPESRLAATTRFSVLLPESLFREAQRCGWATPYANRVNGVLWGFVPELLPSFVELYTDGVAEAVATSSVQLAVLGAGLVSQASPEAGERARQATTRLKRDAVFGGMIVRLYGGQCAMCGLNLNLVSGAHILPVSAPASRDIPENGICLCDNHHRAFDRHHIWINPGSHEVRINPAVVELAAANPRSAAFLAQTYSVIRAPADPMVRPSAEMFAARYAYFDDEYEWAG